MTTYTVYTKSDDKVWLYSDDTFTLAISDCSDPSMADQTTETTPEILADIFTANALRGVLADMEAYHASGEISIHELDEAREGKLGKAIALAG
jgi:hypothetical protein